MDPWDWGALYACVATATGWTFDHINRLSLDDLATLWLHWQDSPPVHISLAALLRGGSGKGPDRTVAPRSGDETSGAMEAVAAVLGPPQHPFRPPCRMQRPDAEPIPE